MKMADLKNLLVDKLLVLTNGKVSQGVKDYMNTEVIAKGAKFSRKALEDLDYRRSLLADPNTMSYNEKWGGAIDFPEKNWAENFS